MKKTRRTYLGRHLKTLILFFTLSVAPSLFLVAQTTSTDSIASPVVPAVTPEPPVVTSSDTTTSTNPATTIIDTTKASVPSTPSAEVVTDTTKKPDTTIPSTAVTTTDTTKPVVLSPSITKPKSFGKKSFVAEFMQREVELKKSEIVSNVLRIVNTGNKPVSFYLDVNHPLKWKTLTNTTKLMEAKPGDTLYIPIRVIPGTEFKGNMSYLINAFITNEEGKQIASDLFFAATKKVVKWEMNVLPRERIYFLNNEKTTSFGINIFNAGNENQDILLTMNEIGRNIIIQDTSGKIISKKFFDLNVPQERDTTLFFKMSYFDGKRNFKMVDNETYIPKSDLEERKFSLFTKTTESKQASKDVFTTGKKIDFIRLSNQKKVNPYGTSVVPLIVDANIYNVLGNQPIMNLILKGNTILENGANLIYFSQLNYSAYSRSDDFFRNNAWFIGYYEKRGDIQIGNVASTGSIGLQSSGYGISGHYNINKKQTVGGFYTRTPTLFGKADRVTFGVSHRYIFDNKKQLQTSLGRMINEKTRVTTDFIGGRFGFNLTNQHQIGFGGTFTRSVNNNVSANGAEKYGYLVNANYSGLFLKNKLATNLRASYNNRNFAAGTSDRLILTHRSVMRITKKWATILQNNYNRFEAPYYKDGTTSVIKNMVLNNQLFFSNSESEQKFIPSIFYNISNVFMTRLHYRGLAVDYNYFSMEKNLRFSTSVKGGYNNLLDYENIREYFTLQLFTLCQYQNLSLNIRYNYGPQGVRIVDSSLGYRYPQLIYSSFQYQYLFKDIRFMLQTSANYSYSNVSYSHSMGVFPELYFFSYGGWRFKLTMGYSLNISNRKKAGLYDPTTVFQRTGEESLKPDVSQGFTMGAGIRKEFGIPIPKRFTSDRFSNVQFIAFLDANGNRVKDNDEIPLENVVVRLNEDEVITGGKGDAKFLNIRNGNYLLSIIPLEDYKGWFPLKEDSVSISENGKFYIPFARGVKLSGNIVLDREKYAADAGDPFDLSRIRVSVTDSAGKTLSTLTDAKGTYSLYVPSGKYMLSMDENILGDRFALAENNIEVELQVGMEGFFYSFYVVEKKRRIIMRKAGN
ncbi:MAG TPA: hypothetical protein PK289_03050 [Bacteroidia bacterium]|nr:hypothetical protein [Bacteroidia bacterium]